MLNQSDLEIELCYGDFRHTSGLAQARLEASLSGHSIDIEIARWGLFRLEASPYASVDT